MSRRPFFLTGALGLSCLFLITGCASRSAYRYETIKSQYADMACNLAAAGGAGDVSPTTCAVNSQLTLDAVLNITRSNNPDLLMAVARIERAQALLRKAGAPFYPRVSVYTEYMQGDAPSAYLFKTIDERQLPPNTDFNDPGWFENYESGVNAGINLFNGGRDWLNHEIAKSGLSVAGLDRDGVENQVVATAIGAYYDVLAAAKFITVAEEAVETTRSQLQVMDVRYRSGSALKTDLLSLQVRLAESEEMLVRQRNRKRLAMAGLAEILGVEPNVPFGLVEAAERQIAIPEDPISALEKAMGQRPELASVREKVRQSRMAMDAARAGYLPSIDFMARYYADDPQMRYSSERDNWTAALMLNWTLFDGFATQSGTAEARSQLQEAMAADRKTLLAVKFDVKKSYLNLDEARQRLKVAASNVTTARETLDLVKRQYSGGAASITRFLETELAYNQARIHETAAYYDQEKARAQIARAVGDWIPSRKGGTTGP